MKKAILLLIVAGLVIGAVIGLPYVKDYYSKSVSEYISEQRSRGIGSKIPDSFVVSNRAGEKVRINQEFPAGLVLMVYDRNCPACREAVAYAEVYIENNPATRRFAVLEFSRKLDPELKNLQQVEVFLSGDDQDDTLFQGRASPMFFLFDQETVIRQKEIGWNEEIFHELLSEELP